MTSDASSQRRLDPESEILDAWERFLSAGVSIPVTPEGKVNVTSLVAVLQLRPGDAQYFHRSPTIKEAVNAVAEARGVLPIGHRVDQSRADLLIAARIQKTDERARADAQGSVETRHAYEALMEEHIAAQARIGELEFRLSDATRRLSEYERIMPFDRLTAGLLPR